MTDHTDSYNCFDVVIDDTTDLSSPPGPLPPKLLEHLRRERERILKYGGSLSPGGDRAKDENGQRRE